jgi:tRNA-Thr(GGU) m(6)t(6)A37 methyltransferase TsaA
MTLEPIGTIHTPYTNLEQMPIQPKGAAETIGTLVIHEAYKEGLKDLDGFSHMYILYHFHKAMRSELLVTPFMDTEIRGVFATRSPLRPSHIGMSVSQIICVEDNIVTLKGIDVLDGTPLLDIKPYIPQFDTVSNVKTGWMNKNEAEVANTTSDSRFI